MRFYRTLWEAKKLFTKMDKYLRLYGMPFGLLALVVLLKIAFIDVPLFSSRNLGDILLENVSVAIMALGLSFIMMSGEGDLSFAGMFSLLAVIFRIWYQIIRIIFLLPILLLQ